MAESLIRNRERLRQMHRDNPGWNTAGNKAWIEKNRDKYRAHKAVAAAIKIGRLTRQPCERCGATELVHAHHDDYSKRLAVLWLCPTHHRERHREVDVVRADLSADDIRLPGSRLRQNRRAGATGYKGVTANGKRYYASICRDGMVLRIGSYATAEEAARAYDACATEMRGANAITNFPATALSEAP